MVCRLEPVAGATWQYCPDALLAPGVRLRALVMARVVDEVSGQPPMGASVRAIDPGSRAHLVPRVSGAGMLGLAGRPAEVFPGLGGSGAPVPMAIEAPGYLPRRIDGTLGPIAGFPDVFVPLDHGEVFLHRIGVALRGRVVRRATPANIGLAGATVAIDGIWPTYPPPNVMPGAVMQPARMTSLAPGLYRDRPAATLARCDVVANVLETKQLMLPAAPGATRLRLSNRRTLVAGMPLLVDEPDAERIETIAIAAVDTSFSDDQAAWIDLAYPLAHAHRPGTGAVPTSIPATHDPLALARPALTGDAIAFLAASPPWPDGSLVRVDDGVNPPEFHRHARHAAVTDADGYFRLPAVARLALFRLRATHPIPPAPLLTIVEPDYALAEQTLQVAFE